MAFPNAIHLDQHLIRARLLEDGTTVEARLFLTPELAEGGDPVDGWTVTVDGAPVDISAAEIDEEEPLVLLTIPRTASGRTILLSYDPETGSITGDGFPLLAFTDRAVANFSEVRRFIIDGESENARQQFDAAGRVLITAAAETENPKQEFYALGAGIIGGFGSTDNAAQDFDGVVNVVISAAGETDNVAQGFDAEGGVLITCDGETATPSQYFDGVGTVQSYPEFVSAEVQASGQSIAVTFDKNLASGSATDGFTWSGGTILSGSYSGSVLTLVIVPYLDSSPDGTLTYSGGTLAGSGGAVANFGPVTVTNNSTFAGTWTTVGNSASWPGGTTTVTKFGVDALNSTDLVIVDDVSDVVRVSRFTSPNWGALGSTYSISSLTNPGVCNIDGSTVAVFKSNTTAGLFKLAWSGSAFSASGSQLNITGSNQGIALCRLSSTRVVLIDSQADTMRTYDVSGSTPAAVGNSYSLGGINGAIRAVALTSSLIALSDTATNSVNLYSFNGTDWSLVAGSTLSVDTVLGVAETRPCVGALNQTDIVIGGEAGKIQAMRWSGSAWSTLGSSYTVSNTSSSGTTAIVGMGSNEVAFMRASTNNSFLRRLKFQ